MNFFNVLLHVFGQITNKNTFWTKSYFFSLEYAITRPRSSGGDFFISRTRRAAAKNHSRQQGKNRQRRHNHDGHAHAHHEGGYIIFSSEATL